MHVQQPAPINMDAEQSCLGTASCCRTAPAGANGSAEGASKQQPGDGKARKANRRVQLNEDSLQLPRLPMSPLADAGGGSHQTSIDRLFKARRVSLCCHVIHSDDDPIEDTSPDLQQCTSVPTVCVATSGPTHAELCASGSDQHGGGDAPDACANSEAPMPQRALAMNKSCLVAALDRGSHVELRARQHHYAGHQIYLMEANAGVVRGIAVLEPARRPTAAELESNAVLLNIAGYAHPWAWPLASVTKVDQEWCISKEARRYCPTWVPRKRWEAFLGEA